MNPDTLPKLETKHVAWIFQAAGEAFEKHVEEAEMEIIRHTHFAQEPICRTGPVQRTREEKIKSARDSLESYRMLVQFCHLMRMRAAEQSATEFAKAFKGFYGK